MNKHSPSPTTTATERMIALLVECLWWAFSLLLLLGMYQPLLTSPKSYPLYFDNSLAFLVGFHATRMLFTYRYIPYLRSPLARAALIVLSIIALLYTYISFLRVSIYVQDRGFYELFEHLHADSIPSFAQYAQFQLVLSYALAFVGLTILPFVLLYSLYRTYASKR